MSSVPEIDVDQLAAALGRGAMVVDVREPLEYVTGHVPGAELIPMGELPSRTVELNRSEPVYVICASGNRSAAVTAFLRQASVEVWSVAGGTKAWAAAGRPLVTGPPQVPERATDSIASSQGRER